MLSAVIRSTHSYPACPLGRRTGIPEVCPSRSSRTMEGFSQCSSAYTGYGPNCLQLLLLRRTSQPRKSGALDHSRAFETPCGKVSAKGIPLITQGVRLYLHLANCGNESRRVMSVLCQQADIPSFRMKSLRGQAAATVLLLRLSLESQTPILSSIYGILDTVGETISMNLSYDSAGT